VIDPGETVLDLTRREADLAVRTVRPVRGDLVVTRVATVRWVLVAAPAMARALGMLRSWTDAPWVGWGERFSSIAPERWRAIHARCRARGAIREPDAAAGAGAEGRRRGARAGAQREALRARPREDEPRAS